MPHWEDVEVLKLQSRYVNNNVQLLDNSGMHVVITYLARVTTSAFSNTALSFSWEKVKASVFCNTVKEKRSSLGLIMLTFQ